MTIEDVTLVEQTGTNGGNGVGYHEVYHVYFSGAYDAAALVNTTDARLPLRGGDKAGDAKAFAGEVKVSLQEGSAASGNTADAPGVAVYDVTYAQKAYNYDLNPLDRPAEIEGGGSELTEVFVVDVNGDRIENSAGELYDGIPDRPIRGADFAITRNEATNPAQVAADFSNSTNDAAWHGVDAGNALFGKITFAKTSEVVNGTTFVYWKVTYPIRIRRDGWRFTPLDSGFVKTVDATTKRVITDDAGQPTLKPALLDGAGGELAAGDDPVPYPADGYQLIEESNWGELDLPDPFA